jgi:hypothetical protein
MTKHENVDFSHQKKLKEIFIHYYIYIYNNGSVKKPHSAKINTPHCHRCHRHRLTSDDTGSLSAQNPLPLWILRPLRKKFFPSGTKIFFMGMEQKFVLGRRSLS